MSAQPLKSIGIATAAYTVLHCVVGGNYGELPTKNGVKKVAVLAIGFARDLLAATLIGVLAVCRLKKHTRICAGTFLLSFAALRWFDRTRADKNDPVNQISGESDGIVANLALLALIYKPILESITKKSS